MTANITPLDDHLPVWRVAREACLFCKREMIATVHAEADMDALECPDCGRMAMRVTHWLVSDKPEVWMQRAMKVTP